MSRAVWVALGLFALQATAAHAMSVQVRWLPSTGPGVAGYRVYLRPLGGVWGPAVDAGLPSPGTDGTLSWVLGGVPAPLDFTLALTAYNAEGAESAFSNELEPGSGGGGGGGGGDGGDDDGGGGGSGGGDGPSTCEDASLAVSRFTVRGAGRRRRVVARGSFPTPEDLDPTRTGAEIEVQDGNARAIYVATVPAKRMKARQRRRVFRYRRGRKAPPGAAGLRRLVLKNRRGITDVVMVARVPADAIGGEPPRLAWILRLGDAACLRDPSLDCDPSGRGVRCE